MSDPTTYNGTPLGQMTSRQLIGVIEELERRAGKWLPIESLRWMG